MKTKEQRAVDSAIDGILSLTGETVGPSGHTWQDIAYSLSCQLDRIASGLRDEGGYGALETIDAMGKAIDRLRDEVGEETTTERETDGTS